jgi:hypothetical protein
VLGVPESQIQESIGKYPPRAKQHQFAEPVDAVSAITVMNFSANWTDRS